MNSVAIVVLCHEENQTAPSRAGIVVGEIEKEAGEERRETVDPDLEIATIEGVAGAGKGIVEKGLITTIGLEQIVGLDLGRGTEEIGTVIGETEAEMEVGAVVEIEVGAMVEVEVGALIEIVVKVVFKGVAKGNAWVLGQVIQQY